MRLSAQVRGYLPILAVALCFALFVGLWSVVATVGGVRSADRDVVEDTHPFAIEPFLERARELTLVGGTLWILGITGGVAVLLFLMRYRVEAIAVASSVVATELVVRVAKETATRPRPPAVDATDHASGFSFPSGHASASLALFGSLAFLLSRRLPLRWQVYIWSAASALVIVIGATRVYLGVHYPTDIAAGWLLAGAVTIGIWTLLLRRDPLRFSLPDLGMRLGMRKAHEFTARDRTGG